MHSEPRQPDGGNDDQGKRRERERESKKMTLYTYAKNTNTLKLSNVMLKRGR